MKQLNINNDNIRLLPGLLIKITIKGLQCSQDGFFMGGIAKEKDALLIFEEINLKTYPSSNDFFGNATVVNSGDEAIIVKYIGRPERITRDPKWFKYDVYEILINGCIRQIFAQNIRKY
jgi:hypothetical protein